TGSMATILIESFIRSGALLPDQITITNRTISKAHNLAARYPGLQVCAAISEVASACDILFICVKPLEFKRVIDELIPVDRPEMITVSITSPVLIEHLENSLKSKIAKVIPSITNYVCSGASICMYGSRMEENDRLMLEQLLKPISRPIHIAEKYTRMTSDLSSCGPAFIAFFMQKWVDAAVEMIGIDREEASRLGSEMLLGTGKLLTEGSMSL
ncbi:late competence protein ComER, partial [Clostridium perfringens]|nr:late competence protein ComER [Clostridium perfringens]